MADLVALEEGFANGIQLGFKYLNGMKFTEPQSNRVAEAKTSTERRSSPFCPTHREVIRKNLIIEDQNRVIIGYRELLADCKLKTILLETTVTSYMAENNDLRRLIRKMKTDRNRRDPTDELERLTAEKKALEEQVRRMRTAMKETEESLSSLRLNHEVTKMDNEILQDKLREQEQTIEANKTKVTCAVCMEPFGGRMVPQIGSCGHSVCGMCRAALPRKNCPICREEFAFRFSKKNFLAEDLLQVLNPYNGVPDLVPIVEADEEEEDDEADLIEFSFTDYEEDSNDELEDLRAVRDDSGAESEDWD